jgi:hypothetical protein
VDIRKELELSVAQLRHAYAQLKAGRVARQEEFADGLIGREVRRLERVLQEL